jgi:hypothetical protein
MTRISKILRAKDLAFGVTFPSRRTATNQSPSIPRFRSRPRRIVFFVLAFAWVVLSLPMFIAHDVKDRLVGALTLFVPVVGTYWWKGEQALVRDFVITQAAITDVDRWRRSGQAGYMFAIPENGALITGRLNNADDYKVGMMIPVLYSRSNPSENSAVSDFLFYRIEAES